MIITPSMIENATRVLSSAPDGSIANAQAIVHAKGIVKAHASQLESFLAKRPNTSKRLRFNLEIQIECLKNLAKDMFMFENSNGCVEVIHADNIEEALHIYVVAFGACSLIINGQGYEWRTNSDCSDLWMTK